MSALLSPLQKERAVQRRYVYLFHTAFLSVSISIHPTFILFVKKTPKHILFVTMYHFTDQNQHTTYHKWENKGCHTVQHCNRSRFVYTHQHSKQVRHDQLYGSDSCRGRNNCRCHDRQRCDGKGIQQRDFIASKQDQKWNTVPEAQLCHIFQHHGNQRWHVLQ